MLLESLLMNFEKKWMQAKEYHASPNDFPESSNYRYKWLLFKFM